MTSDPIIIIVACPACQGEGGHEHVTGFDYVDGSERVRFTRCDVCEGTGSVEEEVQPRTLDDLEQIEAERRHVEQILAETDALIHRLNGGKLQ
jgi:hypothetical protein